MKIAISSVVLLTIISNALAMNQNRLLWTGNQPPSTTEETQVVEIVRWQQPICLQPAYGVSSCLHSLRKLQKEYEQVSGKSFVNEQGESLVSEDEETSSKILPPEVITWTTVEDLRSLQGSEEPHAEESLESNKKSSVLPKDHEEAIAEGRYLVPPPEKLKKPQQIYVTKVLQSPVTATLVAYNCVPEVGIPLCEDHQGHIEPSKPTLGSIPSLSISIRTEDVSDQKRSVNV
ncbi:unnamed protein product [Xylocopa violacea]|uniref:Uncharacterized protein n=1 Tax=Xylocopa violacea TaxID=135666 RepID=A0ABP1NI44_XYLVO